MKRSTLCAILAVCLLGIAAVAPLKYARDISVDNQTDTVAITLQKSTLTSNFVEAFVGSALTFAVPASGVLPATYGGTGAASVSAAKTALGIQSGSATASADGTVTNTFSTAFASAPVVLIVQTGDSTSATNALTVTSTNFLWTTAENGTVGKWIAIGAP